MAAKLQTNEARGPQLANSARRSASDFEGLFIPNALLAEFLDEQKAVLAESTFGHYQDAMAFYSTYLRGEGATDYVAPVQRGRSTPTPRPTPDPSLEQLLTMTERFLMVFLEMKVSSTQQQRTIAATVMNKFSVWLKKKSLVRASVVASAKESVRRSQQPRDFEAELVSAFKALGESAVATDRRSKLGDFVVLAVRGDKLHIKEADHNDKTAFWLDATQQIADLCGWFVTRKTIMFEAKVAEGQGTCGLASFHGLHLMDL